MELLKRIESKQARLGVIGLGYVGLPLAVEFARAGFRVVGFDVDEARVAGLNRGESYIPDVAVADLKEVVDAGRFLATTDPAALADVDIIDICVPTPLRKTKDPDLSYVVKAVETTAGILRKGQLVILESTTYPGTTDEVVRTALEGGYVGWWGLEVTPRRPRGADRPPVEQQFADEVKTVLEAKAIVERVVLKKG